MDWDPAPAPAILVIDLQDTNKKLFSSIFCSLLFECTITVHHFSKIKGHKEVTKRYESRFFLLFCLIEGIRIRISD
jgi:hypothetical protein